MVETIQYITSETPGYSLLRNIERNCSNGVRWIQLRMKDASPADIENVAQKAKEICDRFDARLIINDHPEIALRVKAHGVHLGRNDMPVKEARTILGNNFIIGGTANTFEEIKELSEGGADYAGLGPFRFTTTKKNLSPILGISGYENIIKRCFLDQIHLPVFAIGGIQVTDVEDLMNTGISGIAISGALSGKEAEENIDKIRTIIEIHQRKKLCYD